MSSPVEKSQVLIGNKTSPYVRRFRLWLHERVKYDFKVFDYLNVPADEIALAKITPINKVPLWIDGDQLIYESRVIANYLTRKHGWTPPTMEEENMLSMIDAANDVAVNLFLLGRSGIDVTVSSWYVDRQKARIPAMFGLLEPWAKTRDEKNPAHWNYVTASLLSYVDWANFRKMADFTGYPGLTDFARRFGTKPNAAETAPR